MEKPKKIEIGNMAECGCENQFGMNDVGEPKKFKKYVVKEGQNNNEVVID